jgi:hypothetical protein
MKITIPKNITINKTIEQETPHILISLANAFIFLKLQCEYTNTSYKELLNLKFNFARSNKKEITANYIDNEITIKIPKQLKDWIELELYIIHEVSHRIDEKIRGSSEFHDWNQGNSYDIKYFEDPAEQIAMIWEIRYMKFIGYSKQDIIKNYLDWRSYIPVCFLEALINV